MVTDFCDMLTQPHDMVTEHADMLTQHRDMVTDFCDMLTEHRDMATDFAVILTRQPVYPCGVRGTLGREGGAGEGKTSYPLLNKKVPPKGVRMFGDMGQRSPQRRLLECPGRRQPPRCSLIYTINHNNSI